MSSFRVASRYAKSLLELAKDQNKLEEVNEDMRLIDQVCRENHDLVLLLKNPIINHSIKKTVLHALFEGKINDLTMAILDITTRKNREPLLPLIASEFHLQYNHLKGIQEASVTTSFALDDSLRKKINDIVIKISKGNSVELTEIVDESIIGGYLLKVGDTQLDDTLSSKLKELDLEFKHTPSAIEGLNK